MLTCLTERQGSLPPRRDTLRRWVKFNLVGALGILVQLAVLHLLTRGLEANYLLATALAVEAAVLHNFFWHERFTWAGRTVSNRWAGRASLHRLARFNLTTGAISVGGNLMGMSVLVEQAELPFLAANLLSIALCSLANFVVSGRLCFARARPANLQLRRGMGSERNRGSVDSTLAPIVELPFREIIGERLGAHFQVL